MVCAYYGKQEVGPRKEMRERWNRIFSYINSYKREGNLVLFCGDMNCALGNNMGLTSNHDSVSAGGKEVLRLMAEGEWKLINALSQEDQRSHVDRTSGMARCLNFAMMNRVD